MKHKLCIFSIIYIQMEILFFIFFENTTLRMFLTPLFFINIENYLLTTDY